MIQWTVAWSDFLQRFLSLELNVNTAALIGFAMKKIVRPSSCKCFVNDDHGSTTVEYAIFLTMVVGSILLAVMAVGVGARTTLEKIAGVTSHSAVQGSSQAVNHTVASSPAHSVLPTDESTRQIALLVLLAIVLAIGGVMWHVLYTQRKQAPGVQEDDELRQAIEAGARDALFEKRQQILKTLEENLHLIFEDKIQVSHVMSRRLTSVTTNMPADVVREKMKEQKMRHTLVCDLDGRLRGIISVKDTVRPGAMTAKQMMTPNPITVEPTVCLGPVISLLLQNRISCLPVVKDGHLFGVVTSTDITMTLQVVLHILAKLVADGKLQKPELSHVVSNTISAAVAQLSEQSSFSTMDD